ncbi:two-component system sensor histidine kinase NtrB [Chromobacterium sphagni]|uniref:histidine kinase n=1 Tax=Chromobacterium sphagni TaxID=1903179 RepID=A0A1S1X1W5_9NEIS|nr:ATP-binding protein [Chromobacterium sphagni]OHX13419.1 histidine kinase [Chromobacterium sphagni]OHX21876.1 histidine kinase [Chromobacterium sphagni]
MIRTGQPQALTPRAALLFVNGFRALLLLVLLLMSLLPSSDGLSLIEGGRHFYLWSGVYLLLIAMWFLLREGRLGHTLQLTLAIAADIAMMVLLMAMNEGIRGGFGLLLLPYLAAAGLLSTGRYALFYAAIATLMLFGYAGMEHELGLSHTADLSYSALLAAACFVTSIATWQLGRMARASEALAAQRGGEIANLNHLNELILQSQRDAVVVLDEEGHLRQFNLQAARYFSGLQRGQLLAELLPLVRRWQLNGYPALSTFVEHSVRGRQLVGRLVPVPVPEGELRGVVLFMRDMADMAEEAKRVKLAALGRLSANIAHEIRNPLSAISHAADLLAEDEADPARRRLMRIVQDNTRRINGMVEDVLTLGRSDRVKRESIALSPFMAELLEHFTMAQPAAAGVVACRLPDGCKLRFDRGHLSQVLGNLLANAWRHSSRRPGAVQLQASVAEDYLILRVIDDGPGVAEAEQSRLFEPFFTTESAGSGLGLYIARELAEANDARLDYSPPGGVFRLTCHLAYD